MRILVTGANGFIGSHLLPRLRESGNQPFTLSRGQLLSEGKSDVSASRTVPMVWPGQIDAIVHLAALNPSRVEAIDEAALHRANVEGTTDLVRRAIDEGARRVVFVSSANVHGNESTSPVSENDALAPQNAYARSKRDAEIAFWVAINSSSTQGCILRPVPVFGQRGRGSLGALIKLARLPIPLPLKGLGGKRSILAVDHLIDSIILCLCDERAAGQTFLVADQDPVFPADIVAAVREGLGRSKAIVRAPIDLLGSAMKAIGKDGIWTSINASFVVDASHIRDTLGWVPTTTSIGALRAFGEKHRR